MARARTLGVIVDRMASLAEQSSGFDRRNREAVDADCRSPMTNGNGKHRSRHAQASAESRRGPPAR